MGLQRNGNDQDTGNQSDEMSPPPFFKIRFLAKDGGRFRRLRQCDMLNGWFITSYRELLAMAFSFWLTVVRWLVGLTDMVPLLLGRIRLRYATQ